MDAPIVLLIMTDKERYPPPYETDAVKTFRQKHLPAPERDARRRPPARRNTAG